MARENFVIQLTEETTKGTLTPVYINMTNLVALRSTDKGTLLMLNGPLNITVVESITAIEQKGGHYGAFKVLK